MTKLLGLQSKIEARALKEAMDFAENFMHTIPDRQWLSDFSLFTDKREFVKVAAYEVMTVLKRQIQDRRYKVLVKQYEDALLGAVDTIEELKAEIKNATS